MYIVKQNSYTVECQLVTDCGQTVGDSNVHSDTELIYGRVSVTDSGQTVGDSNVHSDTELIYGRVSVSDRQWTDCRRQQCT